jgi:hypothetical protein
MTDEMMSSRALLEKSPHADRLRELIGFVSESVTEGSRPAKDETGECRRPGMAGPQIKRKRLIWRSRVRTCAGLGVGWRLLDGLVQSNQFLLGD